MSVLSSPHFHDEAKAFEYLESIVWAGGVVCPNCGVTGGRVYDLSGVKTKASAKNPNGKVPMLERADGSVLVESNAILCWLAEDSTYLPADAWQRAQALSWLFFEQYSHEPYIAVARFIRGWTPLDSPRRADLPRLHERGMQALAVMEKHLAQAAWFTGPAYGVADIALFAYTHCAGEGGFDLAAFPHITDWLARVRAQPGFVPMPGVSDDVAVRLASS